MPFTDLTGSRRARRRFVWLTAVVLAAGVVAVLVFAFPNSGGRKTVEPPASSPQATIVKQKRKLRALPPPVRRIAGEFILTAVARKNLDRAWPLAGPQVRQGMTYRQWLTGNIAVPTFQGGIGLTRLAVDEVTDDEVLLEVMINPARSGNQFKPGVFWVQLNTVGRGHARRWVVNQVVPRVGVRIPTTGNG